MHYIYYKGAISIIFISIILLPLFLFAGGIHPISPVIAKVETTHSGAYNLNLSINHGLLSMKAERAPFELVLKELSEKTEAIFIVHKTSFFTESLSVSFRDLEFSAAIGRIFRNLSYVVEIGDDRKPCVTIFASKGSGDIYSHNKGVTQLISEEGKGSPYTTGGAGERPTTLDECQALGFDEDDMIVTQNLMYEEHKNANLLRQMLEEDKRVLDDAKIKRAQKVLTMERCAHLWEKAVRQLGEIQDDRVTSILADVAKNGRNLALKSAATEALWHNTAKSEFKNVKGINALKNLTASSDEGVRHYAELAIKDYENYLKRTTSGEQ